MEQSKKIAEMWTIIFMPSVLHGIWMLRYYLLELFQANNLPPKIGSLRILRKGTLFRLIQINLYEPLIFMLYSSF